MERLSGLSVYIGPLAFAINEASFFSVVLDPGRLQYSHSHKSYELHYVTGGHCTFWAGGLSHTLKAGEYLLVSPGTFHTARETSADFDKLAVDFEVDERAVRSRGDDMAQLILAGLRGGPAHAGHCGQGVPLCRMLYDEMALDSAFSPVASSALLQLILLCALRGLCGNAPPSPARTGRELDRQRFYLIDEFFNDHLNLTAGQAELASILGISRRQLDRIMKEAYGATFREKKAEMRTQIATDLLLNSRYSVREISEALGYASPSNFTSFFKRKTGLSPSQLRHNIHAAGGPPVDIETSPE